MSDQFDFQQDVVEASHIQPVLVDFWAAWCGPCRVVGPLLETLAAEPDAGFKLVKVDIERHPDLAQRFKVSSIPAMKLFAKADVVGEVVGALPEPAMRQWLSEHLPSASKEALARATEQRAKGDEAEAKKTIELLLQSEPDHTAAKLLLAELTVLEDPKSAQELAGAVPDLDPDYDRAQAVMSLAGLLALPETAPEGVDADKWTLYIDGVEALRRRAFGEAAEKWIELVRKGRSFQDDAARLACIALFKWLGPHHEVSEEYRRPLSAALY